MSQAVLLDPISRALDREREEQVERHLKVVAWFSNALRDIDPRLELHLAKPNAGPPFMAGYWHVVRQNESIANTVIPITGRNGEFCEPSPYHLEELRSRDMWDRKVAESTFNHFEREQKERRREKAEQRAEINDDARILYNAKTKREARGKRF